MATRTPEYKALTKCMHVTCSKLASIPDTITGLANDMHGNELINEATRSAACHVGAPYTRASTLVTAVQGVVKLNIEKFYLFAEILDEHELTDVSAKLLEKCASLGGRPVTSGAVQPVGAIGGAGPHPLSQSHQETTRTHSQPAAETHSQSTTPAAIVTPPTTVTPPNVIAPSTPVSQDRENKAEEVKFDGGFDFFKKSIAKYNISSSTPNHGIALIINNMYFTKDKTGARTRDGSDIDVDTFKEAVEHLKYKAIVETDLTAVEMRAALKKVGTMMKPEHDSFICCIMSHGNNEGIEGIDGEDVTVEDLASLIGADHCANLIGKPKIFIIQACRGQKRPQNVVFDGGPPVEQPQPDERSNEIQFDSKRLAIPPDADYLFAYCTTPSTMSMRRPTEGAFYMQILCEVLCKQGDKLGLYEILLLVHEKLATDDSYRYKCSKTGDVYRQMGQVVSTLRKKVYFK